MAVSDFWRSNESANNNGNGSVVPFVFSVIVIKVIVEFPCHLAKYPFNHRFAGRPANASFHRGRPNFPEPVCPGLSEVIAGLLEWYGRWPEIYYGFSRLTPALLP